MRYIEPMNLYRLTVGDRGRVVLPAAARRACGMQDGDDLIVMVGDDGVLTLQRAATLAQKVEAAQAALIDANRPTRAAPTTSRTRWSMPRSRLSAAATPLSGSAWYDRRAGRTRP